VLQSPGKLATLAAGCSVVFADIGGNRAAPALVQMLPVLLAVLRPRLMVVKSEGALLLRPCRRWCRKHASMGMNEPIISVVQLHGLGCSWHTVCCHPVWMAAGC
jgi:hypothetical protein